MITAPHLLCSQWNRKPLPQGCGVKSPGRNQTFAMPDPQLWDVKEDERERARSGSLEPLPLIPVPGEILVKESNGAEHLPPQHHVPAWQACDRLQVLRLVYMSTS